MVLAVACTPLASATAPDPASLPATRWDHRPEAAQWTASTLAVVARHDDVLAKAVPGDIAAWCPAYPQAGLAKRRAFWVGMLSAVAKLESSANPVASGGGGRYLGVMQISVSTAQHHGCDASARGLKDGAVNLACSVEIMSHAVARDHLVAGNGRQGLGRDWMPFRQPGSRAAMAGWVGAQSYCR